MAVGLEQPIQQHHAPVGLGDARQDAAGCHAARGLGQAGGGGGGGGGLAAKRFSSWPCTLLDRSLCAPPPASPLPSLLGVALEAGDWHAVQECHDQDAGGDHAGHAARHLDAVVQPLRGWAGRARRGAWGARAWASARERVEGGLASSPDNPTPTPHAHLELARHRVHDARLALKVKLQPNLRRQLVHR